MRWSPPNILSAVFWALWLANFFLPFAGEWQQTLMIVGLVLLAIHAIECAVFWPLFQKSGEPAKHLILTLLFGAFHIRTLPKPSDSSD